MERERGGAAVLPGSDFFFPSEWEEEAERRGVGFSLECEGETRGEYVMKMEKYGRGGGEGGRRADLSIECKYILS